MSQTQEAPEYFMRSTKNNEDHEIVQDKSQSPTKRKKKDGGFVFDSKIRSDAELCKRIFETGGYQQPSSLEKIDNKIEKLINETLNGDKKGIASILGIRFLGMMGYARLSYSLMKEIQGDPSIGMQMGYYASRKLTKKARKNTLTNEDVYILKLKCMLSLAKTQEKELKANMNQYRIMLEKILSEFALAFDVQMYKHTKSITKRLKKLHKFLLRVGNQKAILLSYKLFKMHLRISNEYEQAREQEVADKVYNVFWPFVKAMEFETKHIKKIENLLTYSKIKAFIQREDVQEILRKYPDLDRTSTALAERKRFLAEKIDFNSKVSQMMNWDSKTAEDFSESSHLMDSPTKFSHSTKFETSIDSQVPLSILDDEKSLGPPQLQSKFSAYDRDIDEGVKPTDAKIDQYDTEIHSNDVKALTKNASPLHGLNRDRNYDMHEGIQNSHQILKPMVSNDYPSSEDEEQEVLKLMNDDYLVIRKNLRPVEQDYVKPSEESVIKLESSELHQSAPKNLEFISKKDEVNQKEQKVLNTKTEIVFQKLLSIAYDDTSPWEVIKDDSKLKLYKIKPENSPVVLIRAWCLLEDVIPERVFNCIYDTTVRPQWDTVISNPTSLDRIDEHNDYFYFMVKAPIGVSNRDFIQRRCYIKDYPTPGSIIISFQSTTHPKVPPKNGVVRADTHIAGYIIRPCNNGKDSALFIISQVDIKGSIPKTVVNFVAGRAPAEWISKLKKACK